MEQAIQNAKSRYKRKVEAYTAGLIELQDLNEEKIKMEKIIAESARDDEAKKDIDIKRLEKQMQSRIQNILQSLETLSVTDAKAFIQTLIEKVTVISEAELEIEFHKI